MLILKKKEIKQRKEEDRKDYLLRVVVAFLEQYEDTGELSTIKYDGADCDYMCLMEDIKLAKD